MVCISLETSNFSCRNEGNSKSNQHVDYPGASDSLRAHSSPQIAKRIC